MALYMDAPAETPKIKVDFEVRERYERRIDRDFNEDVYDNRSDLLSRYRLGFAGRLDETWVWKLEWQYAHTVSWTPQANFSTWNSDASLAYAEGTFSDVLWTIGRQKIGLGQQRLIGLVDWANASRSFDGVRARSGAWDLFGAKIGVANPKPRDARVYGISHKDRTWGETSLLYKVDKPDISVTTVDHVWAKPLGEWALDAEAAIQFGENGDRDHEAWAFHVRGTRSLNSKTKAFAEWNAASGGQDPDKVNTFDNLYPSNHDKYGIADMMGWRNMQELAIGLELKPRADLTLKTSFRSFRLQDESDAWYAAGGAPILRDATGNSGKNVGNEFDLEALYTLKDKGVLSGGIAFFQPGSFVKELAGDKTQVWGYLQWQKKF
jgi:hypothetical protein